MRTNSYMEIRIIASVEQRFCQASAAYPIASRELNYFYMP
jgi:hypothetical protein